MGLARGETTSVTLLGRLQEQPANDTAWQEFTDRYRPRIYAHCLSFPLQAADAEDVTQAVLLRLVAKLPEFHYDPAHSFRAWLRTVTRHILSDYVAEGRGLQGSGDSAIVRLLDNLEAREGLAQELEAEFDRDGKLVAIRALDARSRPA